MSARKALAGGFLAVALTGCLPLDGESATTPVAPSAAGPSAGSSAGAGDPAGSAATALEELEVKGRAPKTGYDRDELGPSWPDVNDSGCRTREDVLRRDLTEVVLEAGNQGCVVVSGVLQGPYTGERIEFIRGQDTSSEVQIDHVVSAPVKADRST